MPSLNFDHLHEEIKDFHGKGTNPMDTARRLIQKHSLDVKENSLRMYIVRFLDKEKIKGLAEACEGAGLPIENVNHGWYKGKHWSLHFNAGENIKEVFESILEDIKNYSPEYPIISYPKTNEGHLLVIDPADIHIGKLCSAFESGDEYNVQVAIERVKEGVQGILDKVKGFRIDKILYIIGNDKLHVDTPKNTTTSGTSQDTNIMWYDAFRVALKLDREILELLCQIAPVHVQYDPSNHDYQSGFFLAQTLEAWFSHNVNITFNVSIAHRKYYKYHKNLIGTTHGDGAKEQDLALLMAHEAKESWGDCDHRYFYIHHIHHKKSKDYMSVCVESLRSPSGTDSWHHRNGYQHSPKAIEGFVHHPKHGQIARITHLF